MDIINAAESALRAHMDECAFKINNCIQNQSAEGSLDRLLSLLSKYSRASEQMNTLSMIKNQLSKDGNAPAQPEAAEENEG